MYFAPILVFLSAAGLHAAAIGPIEPVEPVNSTAIEGRAAASVTFRIDQWGFGQDVNKMINCVDHFGDSFHEMDCEVRDRYLLPILSIVLPANRLNIGLQVRE